MNIYKIVIFASNKMILEICKSLVMINNKKIAFIFFESRKSFLSELKMDSDISLIFWEPAEKSDHSLLSQIRQYNKSVKIIMLSKLENNDNFLQRIGNSTYNLDVNQLRNFDIVFNQLFSFTANENAEKININGMTLIPRKILFIETYCEHRNCVVVHSDKVKIIRSALKNFVQLRDYLVKVDRSLIVNLNKIKKIDFKKAIIYFEGSDEVANVSVSNLKKLKNIFDKFRENK